jgi:hypothetical protein
VSTTVTETVSEGTIPLIIVKSAARCSGLDVLPVFGSARISLTTFARTASSSQRAEIALMRVMDLIRVSAFEDFDAERVEATSLAGSSDEMSKAQLEIKSAVTTHCERGPFSIHRPDSLSSAISGERSSILSAAGTSFDDRISRVTMCGSTGMNAFCEASASCHI